MELDMSVRAEGNRVRQVIVNEISGMTRCLHMKRIVGGHVQGFLCMLAVNMFDLIISCTRSACNRHTCCSVHSRMRTSYAQKYSTRK